MDTDEDLYHATPQTKGKIAHSYIDNKSSTKKNEICSLSILSNELGLYGKIDIYKKEEKKLIERKFQLKNIYRGQIYQLWAQYFCLIEMGYEVDEIAFYEISTNKTINIPLPTQIDKQELINFIKLFKEFNPAQEIRTNRQKCLHCIYCNLCDKTEENNVY